MVVEKFCPELQIIPPLFVLLLVVEVLNVEVAEEKVV